MTKIESAWQNLKTIDELASKKTVIHRLHPVAKLLTTLVFILVAVSFDKYDLSGPLPLVLYPMALIILGDLPVGYLFKRLLIAAPFVLFVGIFNPLFDQTPLVQIGPVHLTGGWISFFSILLRAAFTVIAALILIATSGMNEIGMALEKLKVPRAFVLQLLFLYRYLSLLIEETIRILRAHSLRSLSGKGLGYRVWGSLVGQLLLRTVDRAQRIYQAMLCRGFTGEIRLSFTKKPGLGDVLFFTGWSCFFIVVRLCNIPMLIGSLWMGVGG